MDGIPISRRGLLAVTAGLSGALACPAVLRARPYAKQPIKIIVGTAPSGTTDLSARLLAPVFKEEFGQPVVVENRPGAGSTYAVGLVANAKPDGHTLHLSTAAALAVHATHVNKPPDLVNDLAPIGMVCDGAYTYTFNAKLPAHNFEEFVALVKKEPGRYRYGGSGPGSALHLSGELFCQRTGTKMTVVHYNNAGMRATDLLAGEIHMGLGAIAVLGQYINSGGLRGMFVASHQREPLLPDMPTSIELGITDLDRITNWFGLHGPKGMPDEVVRQLNAALVKALGRPEVRNVLLAGGMTLVGDSPETFMARMKADYEILAEVSRSANIRVE